MAEELVVKEALTDSMISQGAELMQKLDQGQCPFEAGLWLFDAERNAWELLLASSKALTDGPRSVYEAIQAVLLSLPKRRNPLSLQDVVVTHPNAFPLPLLRTVVNTADSLDGIRFSKMVIKGRYIEDAYVYRLR